MQAKTSGAFLKTCRYTQSQQTLLALSALMSRARQQLAMFVLSHFFPALLNNAAQSVTPSRFDFARLHTTHASRLSIGFSAAANPNL